MPKLCIPQLELELSTDAYIVDVICDIVWSAEDMASPNSLFIADIRMVHGDASGNEVELIRKKLPVIGARGQHDRRPGQYMATFLVDVDNLNAEATEALRRGNVGVQMTMELDRGNSRHSEATTRG